jgi:hypothetical protein
MTPSKTLALHFGAFAEPIKKQLKSQSIEISDDYCRLVQSLVNNVTMLSVHNVCTLAQAKAMRQRILNAIVRKIQATKKGRKS